MRADAAHRPVTDRRIFQPIDDLAGLGRGIDMRHDDTQRAIVECPRGDRIFAVRPARDRRDAGVERGYRDLGAGFERHDTVLHVENSQSKPVTAIALAISTLRVRRTPTPRDSWPCSSFSRATLRTMADIGRLPFRSMWRWQWR